jgi:hypothetical protein
VEKRGRPPVDPKKGKKILAGIGPERTFSCALAKALDISSYSLAILDEILSVVLLHELLLAQNLPME